MGLRVGLLGVGPVGEHILKVLRERAFPVDGEVTVMATREREEILDGKPTRVQEISEELFRGLDLVFFAGKEGAKGASPQWAEKAVRCGCAVIDNGGDLRMYPCYPLVIPEINMDAVTKDTRLVCNPNCSTIGMAVALYPLHKAARLRRVVVSTYQSVSGQGGAAMEQLKKETRQVLSEEDPGRDPALFAHPIAFDCLPHIDRFTADGYTREEVKMVNETRKIFGEPNLLISATAVRVPVLVGHGESVNAEFMEPMHAQRAREILSDPERSPGVVCIDGPNGGPEAAETRGDPLERNYPVTADLSRESWRDSVLVGRIRDDGTAPNCLNLWCVSDNLRKGAATNAVQIAEGMLARGYL